MLIVSRNASTSKAKKRRLRLSALGLLLLGLWGMLALLLGASAGVGTYYRKDLKADLEPGFGETRATPHLLDKPDAGEPFVDTQLPPPCVEKNCPGAQDTAQTALLDRSVGDGADDATSSIGGQRGSQDPPFSGGMPAPFSNGPFVPGGHSNSGGPNGPFNLGGPPGGSNPNPGGDGNPDGGPDESNPPDNGPKNPGEIPPPDFIQPPFLLVPEGPPNGPKEPENPEGPEGPGGPNGPSGPDLNQPQQIPEPLTFTLFAVGLAGSVLLRRRPPK